MEQLTDLRINARGDFRIYNKYFEMMLTAHYKMSASCVNGEGKSPSKMSP